MYSFGALLYYVIMFPAELARDLLSPSPLASVSDPSLKDLLLKLIAENPADRLTAQEALVHSYFCSDSQGKQDVPRLSELTLSSSPDEGSRLTIKILQEVGYISFHHH
jgi:serine/threonine protein kinase